MKRVLFSSLSSAFLALISVSSASAVESPAVGKFGRYAQITVSGAAAAELYRSLTQVPTAAERTIYSEIINTRRGENVLCTEITFVGVGSMSQYTCVVAMNRAGVIVPGQFEEDGFIGIDSPITADGKFDASSIPGTDFVNAQLTGALAARTFFFMNRSEERVLLDGQLVYRTGKNISCTQTKNGRYNNYRCMLTSNGFGAFTPDNTFLVQPMGL